MSLLDAFFGRPPDPYDPRLDPLAEADPMESRKLSFHVRECARRWVELRLDLGALAIEQHRQNRMLWIVIALLVANKVIDVSALATLFAN